MFVGRWRKVSTAGAVDLSAVSWLSGSGSRVVSVAKGIVRRWKAETGRSDNSSKVNAVDSAGRNPDAGHPCEVELEANSGRQDPRRCRPESPHLPSTCFDLDLGDVEATIACLRSELSQKPPAEVVWEREGEIWREDQGVLRRAGAELGRNHGGDTRGVKKSLAGGSAGACEEAGSMAQESRAASPSLLGCTCVSRSARLQDEDIDWSGTSRSPRAHGNESDSDEPPDGLRQGALLARGLQRRRRNGCKGSMMHLLLVVQSRARMQKMGWRRTM